VDPTLIIFGIRALVRLWRGGAQAYAQYARDKAVLLPRLTFPPFDDVDFIRAELLDPQQVWRISANGPLVEFWSTTLSRPDPNVPGSAEALYLAALQIFSERAARESGLLPERGREVAGEKLIAQWAAGTGPVGPVGRFALTLTDVAAEFVGANPSLLGVDANGEKLIGAVATNLTQMIPDDAADFGPKSQFAERVLGIFLRAGLDALARHPDALVNDQHLQQLMQNTLPPIVQALPADLAEQSAWRDVAEALLGPAANAAVETIAANPRAFLGREFDPNNAVGALTQAMLTQASTMGLRERFSEAGALVLYRAALGVIVDRPELFAGQADRPTAQIARDLLATTAASLRDAPAPFDGDLGADLVAAALDSLRREGPRFLDAAAPWERGVAALAAQVIDGLASALRDPQTQRLRSPLSQPQLVELARSFVVQAAQTPGILAGNRSELTALVAGVAQVIARDQAGLLSPTDWLDVAAVAAQESLANPQRLFALAAGATAAPATALLRDLLALAAAETGAGGRDAGGVFFGATLREAMIVTLRAAAGNAAGAAAHPDVVKTLAQQLCDLVRAQPGRMGSKEWLCIFRSAVGQALDQGTVPELSDAHVAQILAGGHLG
jgi:hypothetical protein